MRLPSKDEILDLARKMYLEDCVKHGIEPLTPEEGELREMGYFERARLALMRRDGYGLEEKFKGDELNYARSLLERNGYVVLSVEEYEDMKRRLAVSGLDDRLSVNEVFLAEARLQRVKQQVWMDEISKIVR